MRRIIEHGREAMRSARMQRGCFVGQCNVVAYLLRRPPGLTFQGKTHPGAWAFVAIDVKTLLEWDPSSQRAPARITTMGNLLVEGKGVEPDSLPRPQPPPTRSLVDRWKILRDKHAHNGWAQVQDFITVFSLKGRGDIKHATYKACKRLRDGHKVVKDQDMPGVPGRPKKCARVMDMQCVYPDLIA